MFFIFNIPFVIFNDNPLNDSITKPLDMFHDYNLYIYDLQGLKNILSILKSPSKKLKKAEDDFILWINKIKENQNARNGVIKAYKRHKENGKDDQGTFQ